MDFHPTVIMFLSGWETFCITMGTGKILKLFLNLQYVFCDLMENKIYLESDRTNLIIQTSGKLGQIGSDSLVLSR